MKRGSGMHMTRNGPKPNKGCWYHTHITECALCCRQIIRKRRMYTPKPIHYEELSHWENDACMAHFL